MVGSTASAIEMPSTIAQNATDNAMRAIFGTGQARCRPIPGQVVIETGSGPFFVDLIYLRWYLHITSESRITTTAQYHR